MTEPDADSRLALEMLPAYRLPLSFDLPALRAEVIDADARGTWTDHWADGLAAPGSWTILPLLASVEAGADPRIGGEHARSSEALLNMPATRRAIDCFQTTVLRARLMRLRAGAAISEHRDFSYFGEQRWSFERGRIRVHLPILTDSGVAWKVGGQSFAMAAGEAWYVNVCMPHSVHNRGATDRINLVLELEVNEWLRDMFPPQPWHARVWSVALRQIEPRVWKAMLPLVRRVSGAPRSDPSGTRTLAGR